MMEISNSKINKKQIPVDVYDSQFKIFREKINTFFLEKMSPNKQYKSYVVLKKYHAKTLRLIESKNKNLSKKTQKISKTK